jgi:hypothetical protein
MELFAAIAVNDRGLCNYRELLKFSAMIIGSTKLPPRMLR